MVTNRFTWRLCDWSMKMLMNNVDLPFLSYFYVNIIYNFFRAENVPRLNSLYCYCFRNSCHSMISSNLYTYLVGLIRYVFIEYSQLFSHFLESYINLLCTQLRFVQIFFFHCVFFLTEKNLTLCNLMLPLVIIRKGSCSSRVQH